MLQHLGYDLQREGLRDTAKRHVKALVEFRSVPEIKWTTFDAEGTKEMVIQRNIPFFSMCEHHVLPFFGYAHVAYIPNDKIVGLSKLARCVQKHSRDLQNQERITTQVADELLERLQPKGVAVQLTARHLCMEARGVRCHDAHTITTALRGAFMDSKEVRNEFLHAIK